MDINALNELVEGILAILITRLSGLYYMVPMQEEITLLNPM